MTAQSITRSVAGWAFGLAVTVLLIGLWGRAIVVDTDTLGDTLVPLSESVTVVDLFADWLTGELVDVGVETSLADTAVEEALEGSSVGMALENFVVEVVNAAASMDPEGATVDVATVLEPAVPEITATLTSLGVAVSGSHVADVVADLDPLVIREAGSGPYVGPSSPIAGRLGTAAALALATIVVTGWVAVAAATDRPAEVRRLLTRVALGGLSFGILLKIGSWILDPGQGRAPVAKSLASVVDSKWLVPIGVGAVAGVAAFSIWVVRRALRRRAVFPSPAESPTPRAD